MRVEDGPQRGKSPLRDGWTGSGRTRELNSCRRNGEAVGRLDGVRPTFANRCDVHVLCMLVNVEGV